MQEREQLELEMQFAYWQLDAETLRTDAQARAEKLLWHEFPDAMRHMEDYWNTLTRSAFRAGYTYKKETR